MADAALDLSKPGDSFLKKERVSPTPSTTRIHSPPNFNDSRRSSVSSVQSDENESDTSLNSCVKPVVGPIPSSSRLGSPKHQSDDEKGSLSPDRQSSSGLRPFKSYPLDPFALYNGSTSLANPTSPLSPVMAASAAVLPTMYESSVPSFPMTPLTSHLLQRKRRYDNRTTTESTLEPKKTKPVPEEKKDDAYWERRRKNNEAAKRSRDSRRCKEEEIAMRAAFLEQENLKLRAQVAILKNETAKLHYMLYNRL